MSILSDAEIKTLTRIKIGIIKTKTNIELLNKLAHESGLNLRPIDLSGVNIMEYGLAELVRGHEKAEDKIKADALKLLEENYEANIKTFEPANRKIG